MKILYVNKKTMGFAAIVVLIAVIVTSVYYSTQQSDINYYQGHRLFLKGEYEEAIPFYETSLKIDPRKIKALREIAYAYLWTKRPEKAVKYFNEALAVDPDEYTLKESLAEAFSWQKKYDKAVTLYEEVILETDDTRAKKKLAEVYIWRGEPEKAKVILKKLMKQFPEDPELELLWGKALLYSGDKKDAVKIFEKLLKEETDVESK